MHLPLQDPFGDRGVPREDLLPGVLQGCSCGVCARQAPGRTQAGPRQQQEARGGDVTRSGLLQA